MGPTKNEKNISQIKAQWLQYRQTGAIAPVRTRPIKMPATHTRRSGSDAARDGSDDSMLPPPLNHDALGESFQSSGIVSIRGRVRDTKYNR
jgi:hypothetical protein